MSPISLRICKLDQTDTLIKLLIDCLIEVGCLAKVYQRYNIYLIDKTQFDAAFLFSASKQQQPKCHKNAQGTRCYQKILDHFGQCDRKVDLVTEFCSFVFSNESTLKKKTIIAMFSYPRVSRVNKTFTNEVRESSSQKKSATSNDHKMRGQGTIR